MDKHVVELVITILVASGLLNNHSTRKWLNVASNLNEKLTFTRGYVMYMLVYIHRLTLINN